ncbi:LacI family DNA-binding transcriptional regulator [Phytohabitans rumicis]|uniref:DNA-binding transcriptional regulator CytR n=1 Tax=Phytohabitans rumicis TaxID=1076125 RepID=A0A6V8LLB9_9ACTN|nr:LacI family DNA-binding transcriptional regulator [Phytohabitans rumicis]GFJ95429.1 DNA-binding transcriptional regulator CytR [Phytohabitans rumicis]
MRDIAEAAEVSQSTVSRVLSNVPTAVPIAPATRERVIQASRRLGYRPNPLARGLRGASTNLLGAVVRDFSDPFYAGAVEELVVEAMAHGYNVVLGHVHGKLDKATPLTSVLETRHTDAIILLGDMQVQPQVVDDLRHSLVPVVALWQGTSPLEFPTADTDDRAGIQAGLAHLTSLGHRRIAFVSAELPGEYRVREDAYLDFMRERFGGAPDGYLERCSNTLAGGDAATRRLLALAEPPTAVATATDLVAIGVLHAAHAQGATVPDRLSVVGFDDILIASHTVPALTTLRMPIKEIIRYALGRAVTLAREPDAERGPSLEVFAPELIVRESTKPLR